MSHLPNKLQSASEHIIGSNRTVFAGQAVKMVSDGIAAIDLTSDKLSLTDITEKSYEKVLCVIPLSLTKHFIVYQNVTTGVGYAVIHNISSGVITPATPFSLTDAVYKAQGYKISASKVCILIESLTGQKILVLNIDSSDDVTVGSNNTVATNYVNVFEKVSATKFIYGGFHYHGIDWNKRAYDLVVGVIAGDDSVALTTTLIQDYADYTSFAYDVVKICVLSETVINRLHQSSNDSDVISSIATINVDNTITPNNGIVFESEYEQPPDFLYRKKPTLIDAKMLSSTKCAVITTYKESTQTNYNFSKYNTTVRIITNTLGTPSITGTLILSSTEEQTDLRLLMLTTQKIITQRHTQKPTNATIYNIDLSDVITKSTELSLTEINAINYKAWERVDYNQVIEYTLQTSGKTSVKIVRTTQNTPDNILGFAKQSGTAGQKIFIDNGYEITGFSGLIQGSTYYLSDAGQLTAIQGQTPDKIGIAINSNKIKRLF